MRLKLEFTTEPFDLDEPPAHAVMAREVALGAALDTVDVGPFGNTVEGTADEVLTLVSDLLSKSLAVGATRISLQLNVVEGSGPRAPEGSTS
ncbi:hypothetical protein ACWD33_10680 [Streptomyces xiamenensis]|uniref:Thiamine-binding protein domain-containing protein n=1 Tax=Streptomyces xiamenensis TaxID=408015 RepID=A0A0F7FZ60_9ACTN|nr:hypothetical protein [Streptomyces xiamenensis]AKG46095.1 hypothetical protein SXIM_47110 [Streptomyces xiamenensis]